MDHHHLLRCGHPGLDMGNDKMRFYIYTALFMICFLGFLAMLWMKGVPV